MKQNENTLKSVLCSALGKYFFCCCFGEKLNVSSRLLWTNDAPSSWTPLFLCTELKLMNDNSERQQHFPE